MGERGGSVGFGTKSHLDSILERPLPWRRQHPGHHPEGVCLGIPRRWGIGLTPPLDTDT